jgi:two-component system nitrogen regulation sensor histidine kinase NtrY
VNSSSAEDPAHLERYRQAALRPARFSLAGKITGVVLLVVIAMAGVATAAQTLPLPWWTIFLITVAVGLVLGSWLVNRLLRPLRRTLEGLSNGIRSFHDADFSVRLPSQRRDELGELARLYNRVGEVLLEERKEVRARELLLQTALNRSPTAILLINSVGRVIFSNHEARRLFLGGSKLEGMSFEEIKEGSPEQMRGVLATDADGIFSIPGDDHAETYHLSQRSFLINRRTHTLVLLRRLTHELGRKEAEIWKKVIRVISHELRNSLAPVSSFAHSAKKMSQDPRHADRIEEVFDAIEERLEHLQQFIEGYARFARLPGPQKEKVVWRDFLNSLEGVPDLQVAGRLPARAGFFDPAQMRQVLINLLRNAAEASEGPPEIRVRIKDTEDGGTFLQVLDRGKGMDDETMKSALLPFYSTKKTGSGLGLPLCREILEAHGGRISFLARDGGGIVVTCWLPSH